MIVRELGGETLVYDCDRDRAICLNAAAAAIWQRCDGATSPEAIAEALSADLAAEIDASVVWIAIHELDENDLIDGPFELPANFDAEHERRRVLKMLAAGVAAALPVISAIVVPTPAQAQSCLPMGFICSSNSQCCSGLCLASLVCA
ncbi:MAG: PqqD family peptide modification chaperone [Gammaproteobacteria bacterium]|nr:PqqD family peptide modification chaperone [Gammaproteobacteria bacterium]